MVSASACGVVSREFRAASATTTPCSKGTTQLTSNTVLAADVTGIPATSTHLVVLDVVGVHVKVARDSPGVTPFLGHVHAAQIDGPHRQSVSDQRRLKAHRAQPILVRVRRCDRRRMPLRSLEACELRMVDVAAAPDAEQFAGRGLATQVGVSETEGRRGRASDQVGCRHGGQHVASDALRTGVMSGMWMDSYLWTTPAALCPSSCGRPRLQHEQIATAWACRAAYPRAVTTGGYSGTPLPKKLGIAAESTSCCSATHRRTSVRHSVRCRPAGSTFTCYRRAAAGGRDRLVRDRGRRPRRRPGCGAGRVMKPAAGLWICWPKKASKTADGHHRADHSRHRAAHRPGRQQGVRGGRGVVGSAAGDPARAPLSANRER